MSKTITKDEAASRYVLRIDGELAAAADYVISGSSISFNHTFTNPKLRGKGYAGEVVTYAVDDVEANTDLRIVPMCWYVGKWFDEHPERAALLER